MLTGMQPFAGQSKDELLRNIAKKEINFKDPIFGNISPKAVDFLRFGLQKKPNQRGTAV